jgi:hypothetical protein
MIFYKIYKYQVERPKFDVRKSIIFISQFILIKNLRKSNFHAITIQSKGKRALLTTIRTC